MVKNYDDMLSRFHLIPERFGRTDGRTDLLYQYRESVCMLTRGKNVDQTSETPWPLDYNAE